MVTNPELQVLDMATSGFLQVPGFPSIIHTMTHRHSRQAQFIVLLVKMGNQEIADRQLWQAQQPVEIYLESLLYHWTPL